jgi:C1A family cysteine protease
MRLLSFTSPLSVEQVIQCDSNSAGCNGGYTDSAFKYVEKAGGIETAADYPYSSYSGTTGRCVADKSKFVVSVNSYTKVVGESNMGTYVQSTGPLSICVDASSWSTYSAGVMSYCGTNVNHCVQAVGVDTSGVGGYWKVKNSWGTSWGESGFIRLAYGKNTCGITWDPLYSDVKFTD